VQAKLTSHEPKTAFSLELNPLATSGNVDDLPYSRDLNFPTTIVLSFKLNDQTSLKTIRIDGTALIKSLIRYVDTTLIHVQLKNSEQYSSDEQEYIFTLGDLCSRMIVALDMIYADELDCKTMPEATVWINGNCMPRETDIIDQSKQVVTLNNRHINKSQTIIRELTGKRPTDYQDVMQYSHALTIYRQANQFRFGLLNGY
jgi:hypothetical protein